MTKLVYPSNGVYPQCKTNLVSCKEDLDNAIILCNFNNDNVPADFPYKQYLTNLHDYLVKLRDKCKSIGVILKTTDNKFDTLSDNFTVRASKITITKIRKNERIVSPNPTGGSSPKNIATKPTIGGTIGDGVGAAAGGVAGVAASGAAGVAKAKSDNKKQPTSTLKMTAGKTNTEKKMQQNSILNFKPEGTHADLEKKLPTEKTPSDTNQTSNIEEEPANNNQIPIVKQTTSISTENTTANNQLSSSDKDTVRNQNLDQSSDYATGEEDLIIQTPAPEYRPSPEERLIDTNKPFVSDNQSKTPISVQTIPTLANESMPDKQPVNPTEKQITNENSAIPTDNIIIKE